MNDCPDDLQLEQVLRESVESNHLARLEEHLSACRRCQQKLQRLAGPLHSSTDPPAVQSDRSRPQQLQRAMQQLRGTSIVAETDQCRAAPREDIRQLVLAALPNDPEGIGIARLDQYIIQQVIGCGGFGVVLLAWDQRLHRSVAIKVLSPVLAVRKAFRQRFLREARAAAAVDHPGVVTIHAIEDSAAFPYIVMEYIEGESLEDRLHRTGPLTESEILLIGRQLAAALAAAHQAGIVHRDIKPSNVLLPSSQKQIRVTDFGLARMDGTTAMTSAGQILGTPSYMSPEQARGEELDFRTDLFSLGSVLFAMAAGHPPFCGADTSETLRAVLQCRPGDLKLLRPDLSPELIQLIRRLQAPERGDRPLSAGQVVRQLRTLDSSAGSASGTEAKPKAGLASMWKHLHVRQRPFLKWFAVVFTLLVAVSLVGLSGTTPPAGVDGAGLRAVDQARTSLAESDSAAVSLERFEVQAANRRVWFSDLGDAINHAQRQPQATIVLHEGGEFLIRPQRITQGTITLQAAPGVRPVLALQPEDGRSPTQPIIETWAPLTVEGLHLKQTAAAEHAAAIPVRQRIPPSLITAQGTRLRLANCRLQLDDAASPGCGVRLRDCMACVVRNSVFFGSAAIDWDRPPNGLLVLENCVMQSRHGVLMPGQGRPADSSLLLQQSVFDCQEPLAALRIGLPPRTPTIPLAVLNVQALENCFVWSGDVRWPPLPLRMPDDLLQVHWSGRQNHFVTVGSERRGLSDEWKTRWQHMVADLKGTERDADFTQLKAKDESDLNAGSDAWPGRLAALSGRGNSQSHYRGPGQAFDLWRQTAAYTDWQDADFDTQMLRLMAIPEKD